MDMWPRMCELFKEMRVEDMCTHVAHFCALPKFVQLPHDCGMCIGMCIDYTFTAELGSLASASPVNSMWCAPTACATFSTVCSTFVP